MNHPSIQVAISVTLCCGQLGCKEGIQPAAPVDTKTDRREFLLSSIEKMGGRLQRENDVPFVLAPMNDMASLEVLLGHMKKAGISLALPECTDLGNGLWKIAPEDVERARAVVETHHLKDSLRDYHFEGTSYYRDLNKDG